MRTIVFRTNIDILFFSFSTLCICYTPHFQTPHNSIFSTLPNIDISHTDSTWKNRNAMRQPLPPPAPTDGKTDNAMFLLSSHKTWESLILSSAPYSYGGLLSSGLFRTLSMGFLAASTADLTQEGLNSVSFQLIFDSVQNVLRRGSLNILKKLLFFAPHIFGSSCDLRYLLCLFLRIPASPILSSSLAQIAWTMFLSISSAPND